MTPVQKATRMFARTVGGIARYGERQPDVFDMAKAAVMAADRYSVEFTYDREGNFTFHETGGPR